VSLVGRSALRVRERPARRRIEGTAFRPDRCADLLKLEPAPKHLLHDALDKAAMEATAGGIAGCSHSIIVRSGVVRAP
jgi:hypothetical protein